MRQLSHLHSLMINHKERKENKERFFPFVPSAFFVVNPPAIQGTKQRPRECSPTPPQKLICTKKSISLCAFCVLLRQKSYSTLKGTNSNSSTAIAAPLVLQGSKRKLVISPRQRGWL